VTCQSAYNNRSVVDTQARSWSLYTPPPYQFRDSQAALYLPSPPLFRRHHFFEKVYMGIGCRRAASCLLVVKLSGWFGIYHTTPIHTVWRGIERFIAAVRCDDLADRWLEVKVARNEASAYSSHAGVFRGVCGRPMPLGVLSVGRIWPAVEFGVLSMGGNGSSATHTSPASSVFALRGLAAVPARCCRSSAPLVVRVSSAWMPAASGRVGRSSASSRAEVAS
jgi:hypothetical protein